MLRLLFPMVLIALLSESSRAAELPNGVTFASALWDRPSRYDLSVDNVFARKGFEKLDLPGLPESSIGLNWLNRLYSHPRIGGRIYVRGSLAIVGSAAPGKIYRINKRAYFTYVNSNIAGSHILFFEDMNESQATNLSRAIERAIGERKTKQSLWSALLTPAYAGENEFCSETTRSPSEKNLALALLKGSLPCGIDISRALPPAFSFSEFHLDYSALHPAHTFAKLSSEVSAITRLFANFSNAFGEFRPLVAKLPNALKVQMICELATQFGAGNTLTALSMGESSTSFITALSKATTKAGPPLADVAEKLATRAQALANIHTPAQVATNTARDEQGSALRSLRSISTEFKRLEERDPATSLKRAHSFVEGVKNASSEFLFLRTVTLTAQPSELSRALQRMNEGADMIRTRFALDAKQLKDLSTADQELELLLGQAYTWNLTELSERTRRVHLQLVALIDDLAWGKTPAKLKPPRNGWLSVKEMERFQELSRLRNAETQKSIAAFQRFDSASKAIVATKVNSGVGVAGCNLMARTPATVR